MFANYFHNNFFLLEEMSHPKTVVFSYGRFNPPTKGHQRVIDILHNLATKHKCAGALIPSHSQDKKKNPLSFEEKKELLDYMVPDNVSVLDFGSNIIKVYTTFQEMGFEKVFQIAGSDRVQSFQEIVDKYNGKPDRNGVIPFEFQQVKIVSSGERDPDSEDLISSISASKLRQYAIEGDFQSFSQGMSEEIPEEVQFKAFDKIKNILS